MMEQAELDQRNFIALVNWHEDDLRKILNGTSAKHVFNTNKRKKLKEYGILIRPNQSDKLRPSQEAVAVLEGQDSLLKETPK